MDHLVEHHDVVGSLQDLEVAVVSGKEIRQTKRDAAHVQTRILRAFRVSADEHPLQLCLRALLPDRCQGWELAVRRVDDQRCTVLEVALDEPELIVVAGFVGSRRP